jgi:hypothetical protein
MPEFRPKKLDFVRKTHLVKVHLTGKCSNSCEKESDSHRKRAKKGAKKAIWPGKVVRPYFRIYRGQNVFYGK